MAAITELTVDGNPYTSGAVHNFSYSVLGAGGPYTWVVGALNPISARLDAGELDTHVGATFDFDSLMVSTGAGVGFQIEVHDAFNDTMTYLTTTFDVLPVGVPVRDADGDLDAADLMVLTKIDAAGGDINLDIVLIPADTARVWFVLKRIDVSANDVTITVPAGVKANGTPDGTFTMAVGDAVHIYSNNLDGWDSVP